MPVELEALAGSQVLAMVCTGDVGGTDFSDATREVLSWDDARLAKIVCAIIDQTQAVAFNVDSARVEIIVNLDMQLARKMRKGLLVAAAAPRDIQFGLSRMWQTLAEATGWEIQVFRTREEALAWLRTRSEQKFGVKLQLF